MKSKNVTKTYSLEFRNNAVQLAINSDQSRSATARELGINVNTLHTWVSKYKDDSAGNHTVSQPSLEDENKRLKKENARLKEEREILKKASAYFASHMS
jgi:transposase|tara:strand:- start:896 stop:1192 length:297 start_codon:yes stop_codon:yes gene_type:complete